MTSKEIDEKIKNGESLKVTFYIRSINYQIGDNRISESQYLKAKERFNGQLMFTNDFGGITKHYYTLFKTK